MEAKKKSTTAIVFVVVLLLAALFIVPFFLVILNSFKTSVDFVANPFSLPEIFHTENYKNAFDTMNFLNSFKNSIIICVVATAVSVTLSSMNAYVLTRKKWKITKACYMILIAAMVVPFQVIMIPLVKMYGSGLGLTNNIWLVTFLHIGLNIPSPTFLYSGFITGVPVELDEAAVALSIWNDYILASTLLSMKEVKTLPLMTYAFLTTKSADYAPMMAGLVLTMLPVMILYLFGQRYIIEGIVAGSVKG